VRPRPSIICAVAGAAAAMVGAGFSDVDSAHATTAPGVLYVSRLVITDHAIKVRVRRDRWMSTVHYLRGAEVRYEVSNQGTHPFTLNILGSSTGRLGPGGRTSILVYWSRRGRFVFRALPDGPRIRVWIN
jgi:hypothetical protein